jgi:hypothetical protein
MAVSWFNTGCVIVCGQYKKERQRIFSDAIYYYKTQTIKSYSILNSISLNEIDFNKSLK